MTKLIFFYNGRQIFASRAGGVDLVSLNQIIHHVKVRHLREPKILNQSQAIALRAGYRRLRCFPTCRL
jgi:hypothetical protein